MLKATIKVYKYVKYIINTMSLGANEEESPSTWDCLENMMETLTHEKTLKDLQADKQSFGVRSKG